MMDLLFKQLGFNPADIKKQVDDAASNLKSVIDHFDKRLDKIEYLLISLGASDNAEKIPAANHLQNGESHDR